MKNIIYIFISLFLISSCTQDFEEINTNPNAPTEVHPSLLLRQVIYNYGDEMSYEGFVAGNLLGQYFTMVDFNLFDRHSLTDPQLGGNPWPIIYKNLYDNEIILEQANNNPSFAVYQGPAMILKSYMTAALTDMYGDIPYSEALQGTSGITNPKYDSQMDIYLAENGILDNLDKAIMSIQNYDGNIQLDGDILFNGDLNAWIRFANSLKIKYLMRISGKYDVSNDLQMVYDDNFYINNNNENAKYDFSNERPNSFRMEQLRDGDFNLFVMSETAQEIFETLQDPRRDVFFRPIGSDNTGTIYQGLLNGPDASSTSISVSDYSLTGTIFREHTGDIDANFMTAWETHFLLAEAAERGIINANAKNHYDVAVQLSFDYWHTNMPANYLSNQAAYGMNTNNPLEQILTQKWIANCINGYENWIEYKRTGFPQLKPIAASLNNDIIPIRMPYPTDEAALNTENYNQATAIHDNSINFPVWWDE